MATLLRIPRKSGSRAPQHIRGINRASPLAQGLEYAWGATHGGFREFVKGAVVTAQTGTPEGIRPTELGMALLCDGVDDKYNGGAITIPAIGSLTTVIRKTGAGLNQNIFITHSGDNTAGKRMRFRIGSGEAVAASIGSSNTNTVATLTKNDFYWISMSWDSAGAAAYVNGEVKTSFAISHLFPLDTTVYFGDHITSGHEFEGNFLFAALHSRQLSAAEHFAMYSPRHRWDIYDQGSRTIFLPEAAAGGGGFQSAWAANSTVTLGAGIAA